MSEIVLSEIEAQKLFPYEDLTDRNANQLSLMLANKLIVSEGHKAAEQVNWAYRVGHPSIEKGTQRIFDGTYIEAISHGVAVLEAMNVHLNGIYADQSDMLVVNSSAHDILGGATEARLRDHAVSSLEEFKQDMPRTTEVISEASQRFFGPLTEYAVLGAAIQRKLVLDAVDVVGRD